MAFWIGSLIIATLFSLALGLNLVLMPTALAIGMSIGTSARLLSSWTCPRCKAELVEPDVVRGDTGSGEAAPVPSPA